MEFHLKNRTIANYATVIHRSIHGKVSEQPTYYNLDIIISVGYPVNSIQATRFRQWTPNTLKEYMHFRKAHTGGFFWNFFFANQYQTKYSLLFINYFNFSFQILSKPFFVC